MRAYFLDYYQRLITDFLKNIYYIFLIVMLRKCEVFGVDDMSGRTQSVWLNEMVKWSPIERMGPIDHTES